MWSQVGAFVHLYWAWGLLSLSTAILFGWPGVKRWRAKGGRYASVPELAVRSLLCGLKLICQDWWLFWRWLVNGARHTKWPSLSQQWKAEHGGIDVAPISLFFGISLGGWGGFATAFYWAERNRAWMSEQSVILPGIFVGMTVFAHILHQFTAWPDRPWIPRMVTSLVAVWVIMGGLTGGFTV